VAVTARSGRIASGGFGEPVRIWDLSTGRELIILAAHSASVNGLAWSPDGKMLLSAGEEGIIQVYGMDIDLLMSLASSRVTRPLTPKESEKYLHSKVVPEIPESDEIVKAWYEGRY
jgi:WD40 repeat protein